MANAHFFPAIESYASGELAVDDRHTLYWEECGNPNGEPILFVHGGPGAGCSTQDRCFFDPEFFRIVLVDQRGCGRSRPSGELRDNSIAHLVADMERLRVDRGIQTWHVFGGSWGSTLALCYAIVHPEACRSLVLRGIWLMRREEIDWWFYHIRMLQPEIWQPFAEHLPAKDRDDILEGYWRLLTGEDKQAALAAARVWSVYEGSCCTLLPNKEFAGAFATDEVAWPLARLEALYFRNALNLPDDFILGRVDRIRHIPAFMVHGRYDIVCPIKTAIDLHQVWPEAKLVVVPDAGHSSHEPGITKELVAATRRIQKHGSPVL